MLVQLVAFSATAASIAACCRPVRGAKTSAVMDCCTGKGHSCPLMKKQAAPDSQSSMKSCPGTDESVASLLFGARGVLVSTEVVATTRVVMTVAVADERAQSRMATIETPPPRA